MAQSPNSIGPGVVGVTSHARSGSNYLEYCITFITKYRLLGKSHGSGYQRILDEEPDKRKKMIFLVRNYKECIPSTLNHGVFDGTVGYKKENIIERLTHTSVKEAVKEKSYMTILNFYDNYDPNKRHLVYYEDLILNPELEIRKILEFIEVEDYEKDLSNFMSNLEHHRNDSSVLYTQLSGRHTYDGEYRDKLIHYSTRINEQDKIDIDRFLIDNHYQLYKRYLSRYQE